MMISVIQVSHYYDDQRHHRYHGTIIVTHYVCTAEGAIGVHLTHSLIVIYIIFCIIVIQYLMSQLFD